MVTAPARAEKRLRGGDPSRRGHADCFPGAFPTVNRSALSTYAGTVCRKSEHAGLSAIFGRHSPPCLMNRPCRGKIAVRRMVQPVIGKCRTTRGFCDSAAGDRSPPAAFRNNRAQSALHPAARSAVCSCSISRGHNQGDGRDTRTAFVNH